MKYTLFACLFIVISCGNDSPVISNEDAESDDPATEPIFETTERTTVDDDTIFDTGIRETQEIPNESGGVTVIEMH